MFGAKRPQVLVVGAGPVGLFAALALAKRGVQVQIVDRQPRTGSRSFALALHAASLKLLDDVGVLNQVLERAYHVRTIGLYDGAVRKGEMRLTDLAEDYSFLAVLRQVDLEELLQAALRSAGVKVLWSHDVSELTPLDDGVGIKLNKLEQDTMGYAVQHTEWVVSKSKKLQVPYVLGADGHRSTVRRELGVGFPSVGGATSYAVFEFKTDTDLGNEMRLMMGEHGTDLCWPLPGGCCRLSFQMPSDDDHLQRDKDHELVELGAERFPSLNEDRLRLLLQQRAPWFDGSVDLIRWRIMVRFESRLAESFGNGRIWLAGDAGHITGPAGVQSMNVGLREARDLSRTIAGALSGDTSAAAFEEYGAACRREWRGLLGLDGGLMTREDTDPWIAARRERLLPCMPASGADLDRLADQLALAVQH